MCKFKRGDKVRLVSDKENNVPMSVVCYSSDDPELYEAKLFTEMFDENMVKCVWRDKFDQPQKEYYQEDILVLVE